MRKPICNTISFPAGAKSFFLRSRRIVTGPEFSLRIAIEKLDVHWKHPARNLICTEWKNRKEPAGAANVADVEGKHLNDIRATSKARWYKYLFDD